MMNRRINGLIYLCQCICVHLSKKKKMLFSMNSSPVYAFILHNPTIHILVPKSLNPGDFKMAIKK